jgi:hypothetical protein
VAPAVAQDDLAIKTRAQVLQDDPAVEQVETTRSKASVRAQWRSDSHAQAAKNG